MNSPLQMSEISFWQDKEPNYLAKSRGLSKLQTSGAMNLAGRDTDCFLWFLTAMFVWHWPRNSTSPFFVSSLIEEKSDD